MNWLILYGFHEAENGARTCDNVWNEIRKSLLMFYCLRISSSDVSFLIRLLHTHLQVADQLAFSYHCARCFL